MTLKFWTILLIMLSSVTRSMGQELYIFSDPASNLPAKSLSLRLTAMSMPMLADDRTSTRVEPSVGLGINKNWMVKANLYASNMMQPAFQFEGGSLYTKYRFLSNDDFHKHFRMAAYARASLVGNPPSMEVKKMHTASDGSQHPQTVYHTADEINIEGNHSGYQLGIVATELIHKLAVSGGVSYNRRWNNPGEAAFGNDLAKSALHYNVSTGYLLFPRRYEGYSQTNFNLYVEWLGSSLLGKKGAYLDAAPGVQFIFKSIGRIDLAYRFQVSGTMSRFSQEQWLLRFEYNLFNIFSNSKQ